LASISVHDSLGAQYQPRSHQRRTNQPGGNWAYKSVRRSWLSLRPIRQKDGEGELPPSFDRRNLARLSLSARHLLQQPTFAPGVFALARRF
jgi:hypothetical protein